MRTHKGADGKLRQVPENDSGRTKLRQHITSIFRSGNPAYSYEWHVAPEADGAWRGVLLDESQLDDATTIPSYPISICVDPDGSTRLLSSAAPGITIGDDGRATR